MPTIKDVARDSKVSIATVSNVINDTKYVSPELRQRVFDSMERLGYTTNHIAKNLRSKVSRILGVVLQNVSDVFFSELLMGLEACVRENGYSLLFYNTNFDINEEKKAIQHFKDMWVDGILLDSCVEEKNAAQYCEFLYGSGGAKDIPIVMLERDFGRGTNAVTADNFGGSVAAVEHLISLERENIMIISGSFDWDMLNRRTDGYLSVMKEHGLTPLITTGDLTVSGGYDAVRRQVECGQNFDAIFAINDRMAVGAILALREYGRDVPGDVAVVGFDNIELYKLFDPVPSTVNVPKYQMGYSAANMLIELVDGKNEDVPALELKTNLVIRRSSDSNSKHIVTLAGL